MKYRLLSLAVLLASGLSFSQDTYGPSIELDAIFSECVPVDAEDWSGLQHSLVCAKVVINEDAPHANSRKLGLRKGRELATKPFYIAPSYWNPGPEHGGSVSKAIGNFFRKYLPDEKYLDNYVPFVPGFVQDSTGESHIILHQGYYDESKLDLSCVEDCEDISMVELPGKMHVLPRLLLPQYLDEDYYNVENQSAFGLLMDEYFQSGEQELSIGFGGSRPEHRPLNPHFRGVYMPRRDESQLNAGVGIAAARTADAAVKVYRVGYMGWGFVTQLVTGAEALNYKAVPLHINTVPEGMVSADWWRRFVPSWLQPNEKEILPEREEVNIEPEVPEEDLAHTTQHENPDEPKPTESHQELVEELVEKSDLEKAIDGENDDWLKTELEKCEERNSSSSSHYDINSELICQLLALLTRGNLDEVAFIVSSGVKKDLLRYGKNGLLMSKYLAFTFDNGLTVVFVITAKNYKRHSKFYEAIESYFTNLKQYFWSAGYHKYGRFDFDSTTMSSKVGRDRPTDEDAYERLDEISKRFKDYLEKEGLVKN